MLRTRWLTQKSIGCGNCHVRSLISSQRSTTSSSASCGRRASHSDQSWRSNPLRTAPMCVRLGAEATDPAPRCRSRRPVERLRRGGSRAATAHDHQIGVASGATTRQSAARPTRWRSGPSVSVEHFLMPADACVGPR